MKKQTLLTIFLFVLTSAILAGCGPKKVTLYVEMNDYSFIPDTFSVPAGAEVTLNLSNTGALEHEYVIMVLGKEATIPFDDDDEANIYWEHELERGECATGAYTAPSQPCEYQVAGRTAGHLEQGMKAKLTVTQ